MLGVSRPFITLFGLRWPFARFKIPVRHLYNAGLVMASQICHSFTFTIYHILQHCGHIRLYAHYTISSTSLSNWRYWICEMVISYILSSLCLNFSSLSQSSFIEYHSTGTVTIIAITIPRRWRTAETVSLTWCPVRCFACGFVNGYRWSMDLG